MTKLLKALFAFIKFVFLILKDKLYVRIETSHITLHTATKCTAMGNIRRTVDKDHRYEVTG